MGCKIYAYCLMTNHIHLIVNPGAHVESLALLMKRVSGQRKNKSVPFSPPFIKEMVCYDIIVGKVYARKFSQNTTQL